jgi:large subunit ribosomal protein L1
MGKTKTAFISNLTGETKSSKELYEEKMKKKAAAMATLQGTKEKAQVQGIGLKGGDRIKVVGGEVPKEEVEPTLDEAKPVSVESDLTSTRQRKIRIRGKKYKENYVKFDRTKHYPVSDAIRLVKETSYSKFDGTVELHLVTKSEVNKQVELPYSSGKTKKIEVASDTTIAKIKAGKIDFDILLATPDMMPKLVMFAKTLGPRGMMPNPKNGTLIKTVKDADKFSGSQMSIKTQKDQNVIHTIVGKVSQKDAELIKNVETVFDAVDRKKIEKAFITPTMGPSVKIQI